MKATDDMAGVRFGKYVVIRRIATGGMAEVSLARLEGPGGFDKLVVVKQVLPQFAEDPAFIEMFLDEGRLAARLSHPNIAQTFELGRERGQYFMAMEYVPGRSLSAIFEQLEERSERLPLPCAMRITMQLLEALGHAHSLKDQRGQSFALVHRDVTPSNVMVTFDGSVKLLDFGIAKAAAQSHRTRAGRVKGKSGYMSPEQCRGKELDGRSDLYSSGALLYQMVTGRRPYEELMQGADPLAVMKATLTGKFPKPSERVPALPGAIDDIVLKAMALKADDRYPNAAAMLRELESFSSAMGIYPSTQKLVDLVQRLFPGAQDEVEPLPPPQASPVRPAVSEKPGPPVPTQPDLKPVVSLAYAGMMPPGETTGERGVQTQVRDRSPVGPDEPTNVRPPRASGQRPAAPPPDEGPTGEAPAEPPSDVASVPEIVTQLSGKVPKKKLPVGLLAVAFSVAVLMGLGAVALFGSSEVREPDAPLERPKPMSVRPAAPETPEPDLDEAGTGTVAFDATPAATVSWGETNFGETPVSAVVPTGEQTFTLRWSANQTRTVKVVVLPDKTVTRVEKLVE
ncbi:MAG: protein kinase [Myxococcaceae bacterium]|nr:protein kinase [Myxococcaceae bacterium]